MNIHVRANEQQDAHRAIDAAIEALKAIKAKAPIVSHRSVEMQVECYRAYKELALDAFRATADMQVALTGIAADLAGETLSKYDTDNIREPQAVTDALVDADAWADEMEGL